MENVVHVALLQEGSCNLHPITGKRKSAKPVQVRVGK